MKVRFAENNIFYLEDYYPYTKYGNMPFYNETRSREIMDLKDNQEYAIKNFAIDLYDVIKEILSFYSNVDKNIGLVAVPPSKVDKKSPIRACIEKIIINYYELKDYRVNVLAERKFLLERCIDVNESHLGNRNSYNDHIKSIKCNVELMEDLDRIILIDDVTTEGITMNACTDILVENGFNLNNIYRLAIGRTV